MMSLLAMGGAALVAMASIIMVFAGGSAFETGNPVAAVTMTAIGVAGAISILTPSSRL